MATINLNIDPSKSVEPLRELADQLEVIQGQTEETGKTFQKSFDKSTQSVDETTDALDKQTKAIKKEDEAVDDLKKGMAEFAKSSKKGFDDKPVDVYTKALKNQRGVLEQLERDIKATEIRRKRANDPAVISRLNDKLEEQKRQLRDIDRLSDKAFDGFEKEGKAAVDGVSEEVGELSGQIEGLGGSLFSGEGGGLQGGLTAILGKFGPIGMAIGATIGAVVALGSAIVEVDKKFDKLRGTVQALFEVTGDEADRIVVNVEAIANTFDEDVNEVLLATNTLVKEFGLTGEEASNLLAGGFNSVANIQGDLIDSVKEYSSQIRASGGDAQDLFNILERSGKEGIFSDKGVDVVKEFGLRIREATAPTVDALTAAFGESFTKDLFADVNSGAITSIDALALVTEKMGGLNESSKEVQTLLADVFGGAGEDAGFRFLTQLKDINSEEGDRNKTLSEQQQRVKASLESNQRLAAAQNDLSKAIGDSSSIGRVWTDIQTEFFRVIISVVEAVDRLTTGFDKLSTDPAEGMKILGAAIIDFVLTPINFAIDSINDAVNLFGFDDLIDNISLVADKTEDWTDEQLKQIQIIKQAQIAIKKFDDEVVNRINLMDEEIDKINDVNISDAERRERIEALNEKYPELLENIDLENASTEDLVQIKKDLKIAIVEEEIARKKLGAQQLLNLEIQSRERELARTASGSQREKDLIAEIEFLKVRGNERIRAVEIETKIQLGLINRFSDAMLAAEDGTATDREEIKAGSAKDMLKIEADFQKAIDELIKRGNAAFLADQTVSEIERLERQKEAQIDELDALFAFIEEKNEILNGGADLDIEVIEAFNRAQEAIIIEFNDKIRAIERAAIAKRLAENKAQRAEFLKLEEEDFETRKAFLQSQEDEELAIIEQKQRAKGESERQFEIRQQQAILDTQQFFLDQKALLIDQELELKLAALDAELLAIADKEGAEFDLKRINLENKKDLLEQETNLQKEQFDAQALALQNQLDDLAGTDTKTLEDAFANISESLSEALNLSPEQIGAIVGAVQQVAGEIFNTIQESTQAQLEANDALIDRLQEREDDVKESLEREIAFAELGYAANIQGKINELAQIEEAEKAANERRQEILKQQEALDTISQSISLITASANLYKSLSVLPFGIGIAVATALTGVMFGAFAASKAKARSVTQLEKGGSGTSTGMITGNRHSGGGEEFLNHVNVERGEMWSVYDRKGSKKYSKLIEDFTNAVNTDKMDSFLPNQEMPDIIIRKNNQIKGEEISLQAVMMSSDIKKDLGDIPKIKDAIIKKFSEPKQELTQVGEDVFLIETFPNGSRKKTKMKFN